MRPHPDSGYLTLSRMTTEQLTHALEVTETHLAARPSWRVGEQVVRMLLAELRVRESDAA